MTVDSSDEVTNSGVRLLDDYDDHPSLRGYISQGYQIVTLIFHSPADQTVSIENADHIYRLAKHPKSFILLENADHLLTTEEDAKYVVEVSATWAARYFVRVLSYGTAAQFFYILVKGKRRQFDALQVSGTDETPILLILP